MKMVDEGLIKPVVYKKNYVGLDSIPRALEDMEARKTWGRALVTIAEEAAEEAQVKHKVHL